MCRTRVACYDIAGVRTVELSVGRIVGAFLSSFQQCSLKCVLVFVPIARLGERASDSSFEQCSVAGNTVRVSFEGLNYIMSVARTDVSLVERVTFSFK